MIGTAADGGARRALEKALAPVRDRQLPAGVLTELARLLPELGDAPPADAGTELRLHNAVRATVAAAAAQGMFALVLDDLHLADAASLDWLRALLAEPTPVWAAALRPGPQPPALQTFLQALLSQGEAVQIALQALAPAAIAEGGTRAGTTGRLAIVLDGKALLTRAQEPEVKARLIANTEDAVARGAFGSPTFFVGGEMFFGKEQLRDVEEMYG